MEFLKSAHGHEDVIEAYKNFQTSGLTPKICFANKSRQDELKIVTLSCEDKDGEYLGSIVLVGDEILRPGHARTVEIESWQWKIARFQFHAMYHAAGAPWRAAHSEVFTGASREISVNYLGARAADDSIPEPIFQWDRNYGS